MSAQKTRRWLLGGIAAIAAAAVALRGLPRLLHHHYRPSAYDDLFSKLADRDSSVAFGRAISPSAPGSAGAIATLLRQRLRTRTLRSVAASELSQGRVFVAGGWVVPESLALICALASREA